MQRKQLLLLWQRTQRFQKEKNPKNVGKGTNIRQRKLFSLVKKKNNKKKNQSLSPQQISGLKKYINLVRCCISKVVHYWHLKLLSSNTWMWVSTVINVSSGGQFCREKKKKKHHFKATNCIIIKPLVIT